MKLGTGIKIGLALEIHDSACRQCGNPKPSSRDCYTCGLEAVEIACLRGESAVRRSREVDKQREERLKENRRKRDE